MSFLAPLITAGLSLGASKLFGPKESATAPLTKFTPPGFNAGGLSATYANGGYGVTPSADRTAAVGNVAGSFTGLADTLAALRGTVTPGQSNIRSAITGARDSRLKAIEDARVASVGNLRENLQRRRVLGSSFGQDAASRTDAEYAKVADQARSEAAVQEAQTYLQELEQSHQLIQEEFGARRSSFQTGLDELNLEASLAAGLTGKATDVLGKNAQVEAMLTAQSQQGAGKLMGQLIEPVAKAAGTGAAGFFGGGAGDGSLASLMKLGSGSGPIKSPF